MSLTTTITIDAGTSVGQQIILRVDDDGELFIGVGGKSIYLPPDGALIFNRELSRHMADQSEIMRKLRV